MSEADRSEVAGAKTPAWETLLEALDDAAWVVELPSGRVRCANAAAAVLLGRPAKALAGLRAEEMLITPEDQAYWTDPAGAGQSRLDSDTVLHGPHGEVIHVRRCIRPLAPAGDTDSGQDLCLVVLSDRSEQRRTETRLEESVAELRATLDATADGILVTDLAGRIRAFNRQFAQLWGIPEDLLNRHQDEAVQTWMRRSVAHDEDYDTRLQATLGAPLMFATDRLTLHSGQVLERVSRPLWSRGRPLGRVFSFRDLSERLDQVAKVESLVGTDTLTGLANRSRFAARVNAELGPVRDERHRFALLLVDLDRFRRINDTLGHEQGDLALRDAAERLRRCMRQGDEMARIGGDQFAWLMLGADAAAAESAARRVLDVMAEPWQLDGAAFTMTCSVGVAVCPGHGRSGDELLRHADGAMRQAKAAGSNGWRMHQGASTADLRSLLRLDHAMRQALASGRFRLHYQPQVKLEGGAIVGAEALIRWRDPELGEIPPGRFIPVAEDTGFIVAIGDWVLAQATRQAARWQAEGLDWPIAVNVSALQFQQPRFVDRVAEVLRTHQLAPHRLELELTERILVHDGDDALQRLQALAALGVRLSIDDFGVGYSNLSYLKRFPIHKLKIDRSFIQGLPDDACDAGIVKAIIQMASALGLSVVAEGVETEPQRQFLADAGCHQFQGFLFAPALDPLSFEQRVLTGPADESERGRLRRVS